MAGNARRSCLLTLGGVTKFFVVADKMGAILTLIVSSLLLPANSMAGDPYMGAAVGYATARFNNEALLHDGTSFPLESRVGGATYRLFAGYSFCPYFALEGGWLDAAHLGGNIAGFPISPSKSSFEGGPNTAHVHGISLDVIGTLPVTNHLSAFASAGVLASRRTSETRYPVLYVTEDPPSPPVMVEFFSTPKHADLLEFGLGIEYSINSRWAFKSDWHRIDASSYRMGNLDTFELAAVYKF